jgi:hypothetical protein
MTALNLLRDIAKADLSMPEKLRLFGRANALNRSADQSERTMMQRRRLQQSAKADEWLAKPSAPPPDPTKDEAEVEAQVAEAMAVYMAECAQRKNQPTASAQPQPEPTQPPPAATPAPQQPIRLPGLPQGSTTPPNPNPPRGGKDRIAYILDQAAAGFPATPAPASRPRYAP